MKRILFLLILLSSAVSTYGQTETPSRACTLKLSQAPAIRGVKLGMTAEDLFPLFASNSDTVTRIKQTLSAAQGYSNFGYANLGLNLSDALSKEQFAGINYLRVSTFDGRIVLVSVQYDRYPQGARWRDADELIQKFSDAFHLPGPKEWVRDPNSSQQKLVCPGFDVFVTTGDEAGIGFVNRDWVQIQKERAVAFEEQKRREFKP